MRKVAVVVVLAAVAAACGGGDTAAPPGGCANTQGLRGPGDPLPDCTFDAVFGTEPISLRALRGKPLVINFWASWCVNCIEEMPAFQSVFAAAGGRVQFLGMNFLGGTQRETKPQAERLAKKTNVLYPLAYDVDGYLFSHFCRCQVRPILPATVFVDAQGVVRERHFGPLDDEELRMKLRDILDVNV